MAYGYSRRRRMRRSLSRSYPINSYRRKRSLFRTNPYGRGVPGNFRRLPLSSGREVPLYAPKTSVYQEMHAYPPAGDSSLIDQQSGPTAVYHINGIPKGNDISQRTGNRIRMVSLQVKGVVRPASGGSALPLQRMLLAFVYDFQPSGALPAATDIYDFADPFSLQRLDTRERFFILFQQLYTCEITNTGGSYTSASVHDVALDIPIRKDASWGSPNTSGAISGATGGALYCLLLASGNANASPIVDFRFRLQFTSSA